MRLKTLRLTPILLGVGDHETFSAPGRVERPQAVLETPFGAICAGGWPRLGFVPVWHETSRPHDSELRPMKWCSSRP